MRIRSKQTRKTRLHTARALPRVAAASFGLCLWTAAAIAQPTGMSGYLTIPTFGATGGVAQPPETSQFGIRDNAFAKRHTTPAGKACVTINASARAQIVNTSVYDHSFLLNNDCNQPIKLVICYYRTQNCKTFTIAAYKREQKLFGISTEKDFRFEFREYAN